MEESTQAGEKKVKKFEITFLLTILIILIILFLIGFIPRLYHWERLNQAAALNHPIVAKVITLEPSTQPIELVLPSTTEAHRETPIWSRVDGYIKNFYVDIGDKVETDQIMLEIYTPEVEKQLQQAKAELSTAQAKFELAKISARRWENLYQSNAQAISPQEVDEKTSMYQAAFSEVEAARANLQRIEKIYGFNRLYAPFRGVVTERNIDIGSLVTAGSQANYQQLFKVAKIDIIRVFVSVPQTYFRLIQVGSEVDIFIDEFPEKVFKGFIARTSKSLDPVARTLLTEIHVNNHTGELITGLYANVHFYLIPDTIYFVIPTSALVIREGRPKVAVIQSNGIIILQEVKIGRDFGKTIEITSGLNTRDIIIINPTDRIRDGVKIDQSMIVDHDWRDKI